MTARCELHFQEGFSGETVEVRVDGKLVESFQARTRMQINAAHVLPLDLAPTQEVSITIPATGAAATFPAPREGFAYVNLTGGKLVVRPGSERPRYA